MPSQDLTQDSTIFRFPVIFTSCESHDHQKRVFMAIMEGKLALGLGLGLSQGQVMVRLKLALGGYELGQESFLLLLFHFCLLIIFIYSFFANRKIRKVLIGVLPQVQAPSPDSSPGSNPGFVDVSLSPFFISKHLLLWLCVTVSYNLIFYFVFLFCFSFFSRFVPVPVAFSFPDFLVFQQPVYGPFNDTP